MKKLHSGIAVVGIIVLMIVVSLSVTGAGYRDYLGIGGHPSLEFSVTPADTASLDTLLSDFRGVPVTLDADSTVGFGSDGDRWLGNVIWLSRDKLTAKVQVRGLFKNVYWDTAGVGAGTQLSDPNYQVKVNGSGALKICLLADTSGVGHVVAADAGTTFLTVWK